MLVLSRKKDEKIILRTPGNPDISITVVRIDSHNRVRLGIEANENVLILRSELDKSDKDNIE
jgi:carbon storage regulator CsrA